MNPNSRPSFKLTDCSGNTNVFVSAGIMPYVRHKGNIYFLMQSRKNKPYVEDLGGKSSGQDTSIEAVIIRETLEELNCLAPENLRPVAHPLNECFLRKALEKSTQILIPKSKYVVSFIELPEMFDVEQFGPAEYDKDGKPTIDRSIIWINKSDLLRSTLHPRLAQIKSVLPK